MVQIENSAANSRWVVLRGLGRGYGHWGSFQEKLQTMFPNDRVYFIDLPGNGLLNDKSSPLKIQQYIPYLTEQLHATDFHRIEGPIYGVGLSLGGMVMTEWTKQHTGLFTKIFLINTSASNFSEPWKRISLRVFLNSVKQIFRGTIEEFEMDSLMVTTNLDRDRILTEYRHDYLNNVNFSKKYPISKKNILRQLVAASTYAFPKTVGTQAILINGGKDRFVNPTCSVDINAKWQSELLTHPTAGHDVAFEDGDWLVAQLKNNI